MIAFTVQGNAVPKQSFRFAKGGHSFQPVRVTTWRDAVAWAARQVYDGELLDCELRVTLKFHLTHRRRVDTDNLSKNVLDSMRNVIYLDDKQVMELHVYKIQPAKIAMTCVTVEVIEKGGE